MLRQQYVAGKKSAELLKIYQGGLLPQAKAELPAGFAAYESNEGASDAEVFHPRYDAVFAEFP